MPGHQRPGRTHSPALVIVMIVLGVLLAAGAGAAVALVGQGRDQEPAGALATTSPSPSASTSPSPSPSSTDPGTNPPPTRAPLIEVVIGNNVYANVPSDWRITRQDPNKSLVELTDADNNTMTLQTFGNNRPSGTLVDTYLDREQKRLTSIHRSPARKLTIDPGLDVSEGAVIGMRTSVSGTKRLGINSVFSVRATDKLALMATLVFNTRSDTDKVLADYSVVATSAMESQLAGS